MVSASPGAADASRVAPGVLRPHPSAASGGGSGVTLRLHSAFPR